MKIGFTGTRHGMTDEQKSALRTLLTDMLWPEDGTFPEFRHGACRGADVEAAGMVREMCEPAYIVALPGLEEKRLGGCDSVIMPPRTHFARNRDIVDGSDLLVGCPGVMGWQARGGTFYTMDYAIKSGKPVVVIWPDGEVEER